MTRSETQAAVAQLCAMSYIDLLNLVESTSELVEIAESELQEEIEDGEQHLAEQMQDELIVIKAHHDLICAVADCLDN